MSTSYVRALLLAMVLGVALAFAGPVSGATRTWTGLGATNNWSDIGNWSGNVVPGAGDVATFDGTSAKNATINVAANVGGLTIAAGYTGTITQAAVTVTVGGTGFSQSGGTFTGSASAITVNGPFTIGGGVFNAPNGVLSISGAITHTAGGTFSAGAGTVALIGGAATIDVGASETYTNLTLTAGNKTVTAGETLNVTGTLTMTAGTLVTGTVAAQGPISQASTYGGGSGTLLINGGGPQTFTGAATTAAGDLPALVINKASGTLTLAGTIRTANNWTYTAGTVAPGTSTVVFAGGTITGNHTLNAVDFRATTSIAAGTTLTAGGTVALTAGSLNGTGTLAAQSDVSQVLAYGGGTATLLISGGGPQTLTGASTAASGNLPLFVINKPSGTLTLAGTIRTANNWTYTAGTVAPGTSTVVFAGGTITGNHTLNAVDFRATTSIAAGTTLTAGGTVALTAGSLNGTGTLAAQSDVSQVLAYGGGTATLLISGGGPQTLTGASTAASGNLPLFVINKPSGTLTLAGTIRTANNWTYTAGTVAPGTSTVVFAGGTITGNHTLNAVDFRATTSIAAGTTLTAGGTVALTAGSLNGTGTLAAQSDVSQVLAYGGGTATLLISGGGPQTLTGASTAASGDLPLFVINKPSGTLTLAGTIRSSHNWTYTAGTLDPGTSLVVFAGNQTITGSHTLNDVTFNGGNTTYTVAAGTVLTVGGTLTLTDGNINTGTVAALGAISQASTFDGNTGTLLIDGAGAQTFTGAATLAAGSLPNVTINKPSGTLTLAGTIRTTTGWTYTAGTLDPGTSLVVFAGNQTITGSHTLNDVTFNGGNTTYTVAAGTVLTVGGTLTLTDGNINTGTVAALGAISQASTFDGNTGTLLIDGAGAQTFTGAATLAAGSLPNVTINKPSGTLTLAGTIRTTTGWTYTAGTLDPGTSLVVFAGNQTITGSHTLNDVTFNGGNTTYTVAAGTVLTVGGTLTLTDGNINTGTVAALGAISQASTFDGNTGTLLIDGAGAQTFTGAATLAAGSLPNVTINKPSGTLTLAGTIRTTRNWTYAAGVVNAGTSLVVFNGSTVTSAGSAFYDVTTNGGTTTLGSAMTVGHDLAVSSGTFTTSVGNYALTVTGRLAIAGTLKLNGSLASVGGDLTLSGTFTAGTSTVTMNGAAGQMLGGPSAMTFFNLVASDPLGVSLAANATVSNVLTLSAGPFTVGAHTLTISNPLGGVITNLAADATSSLTVNGAAAGIVVPSSVTQLGALTVNDASGLGLQANLDVVGTLTLTSGPVTTGSSTLRIDVAGTVVRTTGRVNGYLQKHTPTGVGVAITFEIGDAASYTPVTVAFGTVTTAGELTASTTPGEHPQVATSGLAPTRDVNRFWTLTNSGIAFDSYSATFTFVATDVDAGANTGVFIVAKYDSGTWTLPSVGTRTALSTQATGMTSFSDFALGEGTADLGVTISDGLASVTAGTGGHGYTITVTNGGPSDAAPVTLTVSWPAGFSQGAVSASAGSCSPVGAGPDLSCALGPLAAGASATVTVAYSVPASTPAGLQTASVAVASATADPVGANDAAADDTTVVVVAPLTVTKTDGLASVTAGTGGHAYTITVTNGGPSDAHAVVLDDGVPGAFTAGPPSADHGGDCSGSAGNTIHCTLPGDLAPGATWTISVPYAVAAGVAPQTVTNTATATSAEDAAGTSASDTTDVVASADLGVTISDGLASVTAGTGGHGYTITVTNGGPSDAAPVTLTVSWPAGFSQGAVSASAGSCSPVGAGPDLSCALGPLAAGASATVTVAYSVPASTPAGLQTASVAVASATADPVGANDAAADDTTVVVVAPLTVTKTDGLASVTAGTGGHAYTITVTNGGPSDAHAVVLDDGVPGAFTAGPPSADHGGDCSGSAGNTIHCTLPGDLAPGATWTISVPYAVAAGVAPQTVTNTATATSAEDAAGTSASDTTDVVASADLGVTISDGLASVTAGTGGHGYTITVTNGGPSDAAPVTLTVSWPAGFSQGAVSASAGSCSPVGAGPDLSCALGPLAAGASATVTVAYSVPASTPAGLQTASVAVASATADPVGANDAAADDTTVVVVAPLTVTKTDGLASVTAGTGGHAYTITVTNGGPSDAHAVVLDDGVPGAFTAGPPSADHGGDCSGSAGNTIHCTLPGDLAPGATWTISVPYAVAAGVAPQTVTNTATATSAEDAAGTSASDTTDVVASADLGVTISDGLASVTAGTGGHGYTITVTNGGPSDAAPVTLTVSWPAGFSQGAVSASAGSCSPVGAGPDLSCALGPLAAGASATVTVAYSVPASTPAGLQTASVAVASATADPVGANDAAADDTTVVVVAPLTVTKTDGLASVTAGTGGHAYTITVTNGGPSDAHAVVLDDGVPGAFTAGPPSADHGGDCSGSAGNTIHCTLPGDLAPGATWTISVPYAVAAGVAPQTVTNTATATSAEDAAGTSASDTTDVVASADLGVTISDGLASVTAGTGGHGYTITVTNGGPSDAAPVTLTVSWPAGFSQGAVSASAGSCSPVGAGPDLSCALGPLAAGASATVTVAYSVPASTPAGLQTASVAVASATADPVGANDAAADDTTVVVVAPLTVTKTDGLASVTAGTGGHAYTITVTNGGPSDAHAVVLDDGVPGAFTAGPPSADHGGDCSGSAGNTIHCTLPGDLAPGATWTISVPYAVAAGVAPQTVTNTATATSAEDAAGTSASDTTDVVASADLGVTISDGLASVTAGTGGHGYTITVTNGGPSDAAPVTLTVSWPAGFSQGAVSASAGSCSPVGAGPDLSCALGPLAAGASATVTVAYSVPASTPAGLQTASVAVASATADPVGANDAAADDTTVVVVAPSPTPTRSSGVLPATDMSTGRGGTPGPLAVILMMLVAALVAIRGARRWAQRSSPSDRSL